MINPGTDGNLSIMNISKAVQNSCSDLHPKFRKIVCAREKIAQKFCVLHKIVTICMRAKTQNRTTILNGLSSI